MWKSMKCKYMDKIEKRGNQWKDVEMWKGNWEFGNGIEG